MHWMNEFDSVFSTPKQDSRFGLFTLSWIDVPDERYRPTCRKLRLGHNSPKILMTCKSRSMIPIACPEHHGMAYDICKESINVRGPYPEQYHHQLGTFSLFFMKIMPFLHIFEYFATTFLGTEGHFLSIPSLGCTDQESVSIGSWINVGGELHCHFRTWSQLLYFCSMFKATVECLSIVQSASLANDRSFVIWVTTSD